MSPDLPPTQSIVMEMAAPYMTPEKILLAKDRIKDGNLYSYTGLLYLIKSEIEGTTTADALKLYNAAYKFMDADGRLHRAYKMNDHQSHDDLVYMMCAAKVTGDVLFRDRLYKALSSKYYYYNTEPGAGPQAKKWLGRLPGFIATIKHCAGKKLNILDQISLMVDVISTSLKNDGMSGHMMDYAKIVAFKDSPYPILNSVLKWVDKRFLDAHGTRQAMFEEYFGPEHPLPKIAAYGGL